MSQGEDEQSPYLLKRWERPLAVFLFSDRVLIIEDNGTVTSVHVK